MLRPCCYIINVNMVAFISSHLTLDHDHVKLLSVNLLDPANGTTLKPDFNPVRMIRRFGQDILNNPLGEFTGALVLF
jgi:hypothetical protein